MRRKTGTRRNRSKKGGGCGCGGMEMLGFPKSGGFFGLFGGQEQVNPVQSAVPTQQVPTQQVPTQPVQPLMGDSQEILQPRKRPMMESPERSIEKKDAVVSEISTLKSEVQKIKDELSKNNISGKGDNSPGLFGGYRATKKNRKYLKKYKQGRSIGFTMRSSLKAKGLIRRANGTYKISKKYRG